MIMAKYLKQFVTGHNIKFESNKRNLAAFEKASELWRDVYSKHDPDGQSVVMVAGAKNNGKSSLMRYLINNYNDIQSTTGGTATCHEKPDLIENLKDSDLKNDNNASKRARTQEDHNAYAYLVDFDPGQAEMTSPGIISAHIVMAKAPRLQSPAYLNTAQHEALIMSSVGGTNMSVNPKMYMDNVRFIFNKVIEHRNNQTVKRPIFINTMGHIRNVGLAILMDLIKICQPTNLIVLNVESDPMRTVYADLRPRAINSARASFFYETNQQQQKKLDYYYDVIDMQFAFVDSSSIANRNRVASQLAYISTIPDAMYKSTMQLGTKWLSFKKVSVFCVSSYPLKEVIVLELLQHSWIHLVKLKQSSIQPVDLAARQESESGQQSGTSICKILAEVNENTLIGCGIVADIDLDNRRVAVITPVDQETIYDCVDCIIKPLSIQVPHQLLQDDKGC